MSEQHIAAVDLGSNSFHMIVVSLSDEGQVRVVDRLRESVRLGAGLLPNGSLTEESRERALACLERFGDRVRTLPRGTVKTVGTNTLRQAGQAKDFLHKAEEALGHPISVISGHEEARLIYLGVANSLEQGQDESRRFVMDIGGGSTELIIGTGFETQHLESLRMGCVSNTKRFFPEGSLSRHHWHQAITAAKLELMPIRKRYLAVGWDIAVGASGTIKSVQKMIQETGLAAHGISLSHMYALREHMIDAGHIDKLDIAGLSDERKPVIAGGLAILIAVFEGLKIERMHVSDWALREGLIYDHVNQAQDVDIRSEAVRALQKRFEIDAEHANNVCQTADRLFQRCRDQWSLPSHLGELVRRAAQLHEIGLAISHSGYHKHGAYVLDNLDFPGFSSEEQHWLSTLVRTHRNKISTKLFDDLGEQDYERAVYASVLLRLAVLLHRSRSEKAPTIERISLGKQSIHLHFADEKLSEERPLLFADLAREQAWLRTLSIKLEVS